MTPQDFDRLSNALIGQTVRSVYPGGDSTIGIGLDNGSFFTLTARDWSLVIESHDFSQYMLLPQGETLVSEPSDGIL